MLHYFTDYSPFPLNEQASFYNSLGMPLCTTQLINDPSTVDDNTFTPVHYDHTSSDAFIYGHDNAAPIDCSGYYQTSSGTALYEDTLTASSPSDNDMNDFSIPANYGYGYPPSSLKEASYENAITIVSSTSDSDMSVDHYNVPINYDVVESPSSCSATPYPYTKIVVPSTYDSDIDNSYLPSDHSAETLSSLSSYENTPDMVSSACDRDMDDLSIPNISQFSLSRGPSTGPTSDVAHMPHCDTQLLYLPSSSSVLNREESPPTEDPGLVSDHGSDSDDTASDYVPSRQPSPKPVLPKKRSAKKSTAKRRRKTYLKASSASSSTKSPAPESDQERDRKSPRLRNKQAETAAELSLARELRRGYRMFPDRICHFPGCEYNKPREEKPRAADFRRHLDTHLARKVPCPYCRKSVSRGDALLRHIRNRHPEMIEYE